ncbi:MAG TPA: hypothetical protein ENH95_02595 [Nitrosopumilus sp.]|nr:hypothetical protein [Nitrosopumilus sp.]
MKLSCEKHEADDWKAKSIIAIIVGVVALIAFFVGVWMNDIVVMIVPVSIITFFGVMSLSSLHSITSTGSKNDTKGVMRKSITATLILVFVIMLALTLKGEIDFSKIPGSITDNFVYIIITIIGFYFGTRTVNEFLQKWRPSKNGNS